MDRRRFLEHIAYASALAGCAREAALDPAAERRAHGAAFVEGVLDAFDVEAASIVGAIDASR